MLLNENIFFSGIMDQDFNPCKMRGMIVLASPTMMWSLAVLMLWVYVFITTSALAFPRKKKQSTAKRQYSSPAREEEAEAQIEMRGLRCLPDPAPLSCSEGKSG